MFLVFFTICFRRKMIQLEKQVNELTVNWMESVFGNILGSQKPAIALGCL